MSQSSERLYFNEVVTRDGFQIEPGFIATDAKVALIDALSNCGYAKIEVTSFTSPKAIPMLRDAEEVMGRVLKRAGWRRESLVVSTKVFWGGSGPNDSATVVKIAAPVGVVSSNSMSEEAKGTPLRSSAVPGAGRGILP